MIIFEDWAAAKSHHVPSGHPERPERITAVQTVLDEAFSDVPRRAAIQASFDQLSLVHDQSYLEALYDAVPESGLTGIDGDTFLSPASLIAAEKAAGAGCAAVDAIFQNEAKSAFVAMRPPGHHAEPDRAMGFCFFSNAAIAARYAQQTYGISHVAVLDFDVHHGNGTQAAFWQEPTCFYASTHEMPLFPGTGATDETGAGSIFNQPVPAGCTGEVMVQAWDHLLARLEAVSPELIIISAGFDAHQDDPLASCTLHSSDFYEITAKICGLADKVAQGRVLSLLEGGYDLPALSSSVRHHLQALQGREAL